MVDFKALADPFPLDEIEWRAQTLTKDGNKALALAYIDARTVMKRLDAVVGQENWQDRYEFHDKRTICYISIKIREEWVTKSDGAGDTQVEAEKGAISDAFKRAAVKWGIGRYLYDLDAVWAPCESYERNGKKAWKAWKGSPWNSVRGARPQPASEPVVPKEPSPGLSDWEVVAQDLIKEIEATTTIDSLKELAALNSLVLSAMEKDAPAFRIQVREAAKEAQQHLRRNNHEPQ